MTYETNASGKLLPDEKRLVSNGDFLRKTSLNELPRLLNILKSNMPIIGPRPLLVKYLPFYNVEERHRHGVLLGLTDYAQSHGRNALSWEERFSLNICYARNLSFHVELSVFFRTILAVLRCEDLSSITNTTIEELKGMEVIK